MQFSKLEIDWAKKSFPGLLLNRKTGEFKGMLQFSATHEKQTKNVIFNPDKKDENFIECCYRIRIVPHTEFGFQIIDVEDKIRKSAKRKTIDKDYIHVNADKSICFAGQERFKELKKEIQESENRLEKVIHLAIQFFYHQSYVLQFEKEPWAGFPHGKRGIQKELKEKKQKLYEEKREYYNKQVPLELKKILEKEKVKPNEQCPCGSGKKCKRCHYGKIQDVVNFIGGYHFIKDFVKDRKNKLASGAAKP